MTKVNQNNENETKSDDFHGTYSNLMSFFHWPQNTKIFQ